MDLQCEDYWYIAPEIPSRITTWERIFQLLQRSYLDIHPGRSFTAFCILRWEQKFNFHSNNSPPITNPKLATVFPFFHCVKSNVPSCSSSCRPFHAKVIPSMVFMMLPSSLSTSIKQDRRRYLSVLLAGLFFLNATHHTKYWMIRKKTQLSDGFSV